MPIVEMTLIEGRTFEKKKAMVEAVTDAIVTTLGAPRETVRIVIREVPAWHFAAGGELKGKPPEAEG
ncbi:2-hydroxymuconate tautomerase [Pinisolibacter aquiterrae]|jgi:4-oxalocrotonate tautomerase|uniref:2-hydroxymuconate tautomerase n=1 Tax=Pinisolibacter aquiterrae TaxID=2815579 RepID=UPI001C3DF030|nr:2-hydroxymuconate tautomerase [Pinisolibacter aquiterrae]MBV5263004.1 2-hydroxymuconate tautomerase family protein [Pinisolibacter aquiterrae]MCC8236122.1 2-hydroxymuconate tautomerase family protein [Pinisolibacter aquiterrae]